MAITKVIEMGEGQYEMLMEDSRRLGREWELPYRFRPKRPMNILSSYSNFARHQYWQCRNKLEQQGYSPEQTEHLDHNEMREMLGLEPLIEFA